MHSITAHQVRDDDDDIITTASTDPDGLAVSVLSTGEVIDVNADLAAAPPRRRRAGRTVRRLRADGVHPALRPAAAAELTGRAPPGTLARTPILGRDEPAARPAPTGHRSPREKEKIR